jgi:hypothetical protein
MIVLVYCTLSDPINRKFQSCLENWLEQHNTWLGCRYHGSLVVPVYHTTWNTWKFGMGFSYQTNLDMMGWSKCEGLCLVSLRAPLGLEEQHWSLCYKRCWFPCSWFKCSKDYTQTNKRKFRDCDVLVSLLINFNPPSKPLLCVYGWIGSWKCWRKYF